MAYNSVSGSVTFNTALSPVAYPNTFAAWVRLNAVAKVSRAIIYSYGGIDHNIAIGMSATELPDICASAGGAANHATTSTAMVPGQWYFILGRFISATNRRISVLGDRGLIEHAQATTSRSPTGLSATRIGNTVSAQGFDDIWDGLIAHAWVANIDVQADGTQTQAALLRQLALQGPFTVPHIASKVSMYYNGENGANAAKGNDWNIWGDPRTRASGLGAGTAHWVDYYVARSPGPQPPLAQQYVSPWDKRSCLIA